MTVSFDGTAKVWSTFSGELVHTFDVEKDVEWRACFSPTVEEVLTTTEYGVAKIWSISSGDCLQTLCSEEYRVRSSAFSSSGREVLTVSHCGLAKIWSAVPGECLRVLEAPQCQEWVNSAVFSDPWWPPGRVRPGRQAPASEIHPEVSGLGSLFSLVRHKFENVESRWTRLGPKDISCALRRRRRWRRRREKSGPSHMTPFSVPVQMSRWSFGEGARWF